MKKIVLLYILIILYGCSDDLESTEIQEINAVSGQDLFTGIYFLKGDVVTKIPQLQSVKEELLEYEEVEMYFDVMDSIQQITIGKINELSPNFFKEFQEEIQSGDHIRVQNAIASSNFMLSSANQLILEDAISNLIQEIQTSGGEDLIDAFGENVDQVLSIRNDEEKLKDFLFTDFLNEPTVEPNGRQTCLAKAVLGVVYAVAVAAAGAIDVAISMNVIIGYNYAVMAYTYITSSGNTGQTYMFFNAGVINWLSSFGSSGAFTGYIIDNNDYFEECTVRNWDPEKCNDNVTLGGRNSANLEFEMFVNEVAENLKLK